MKYAVLLLFVLVGCMDPKTKVYKPGPGGGGDSDAALEAKYAEVRGLIISSCATAGCHAGGAYADLSSGKRLTASNAKNRVANGTMPPPNSGPGRAWDDSKKSKLLSFFN